jgi:hypothetical protein
MIVSTNDMLLPFLITHNALLFGEFPHPLTNVNENVLICVPRLDWENSQQHSDSLHFDLYKQ